MFNKLEPRAPRKPRLRLRDLKSAPPSSLCDAHRLDLDFKFCSHGFDLCCVQDARRNIERMVGGRKCKSCRRLAVGASTLCTVHKAQQRELMRKKRGSKRRYVKAASYVEARTKPWEMVEIV